MDLGDDQAPSLEQQAYNALNFLSNAQGAGLYGGALNNVQNALGGFVNGVNGVGNHMFNGLTNLTTAGGAPGNLPGLGSNGQSSMALNQ